jgi:tRNA threonylcarbamoyladenosine biosynthesis protein TsaE
VNATTVHPVQVLTRAELDAWGEGLGRSLRAPAVIALRGELGSGKTTLAQAICRGLGVTGEVTSPTFALVHEYAGTDGPVFHLDLYRLEGPRDLANLGFDDLLSSNGIMLVEWPDRAGDRLPPDRVEIELEHVADDPARRRVRVT